MTSTSALIFVCRPGQAGEQLANSLCDLGINARHTPSLEIESLATTSPDTSYHKYIFISPTAVVSSFTTQRNWLPGEARIIAVGSGTARELTKQGYETVLIPETFSSEGLLAMTELQSVAAQKILIIKGVGGRELLQQALTERGAEVATWSVYRRQPAQIDDNHWQAYADAEFRALTCASVETLAAFEEQRQARQLSKPQQIYVASDRIADHAESVGYTGIIQVGGATNEQFISALKQHFIHG